MSLAKERWRPSSPSVYLDVLVAKTPYLA